MADDNLLARMPLCPVELEPPSAPDGISLQPFNGSTQHSKTSVVRGSLPVAALGTVSPAE